ncbi:hypothetical protein B0H14DRAFT_3509697 [Mycena olivaceomarginata]|nr:hypothetical protein B0H14DRAFT_3509697 [Mycena olivaceomarginata]
MSRLAVESQTIRGTGGNGGAGGVSGGGGGDGEGPRTSMRYDITAESFTLTNNLYVYGLVSSHRLIVAADASIQSQHYDRATQKR